MREAEGKLNFNSRGGPGQWLVFLLNYSFRCVLCQLHVSCIPRYENGVASVMEGGDDFNVTLELRGSSFLAQD